MSETEFVETLFSDDGSVAGFRTCNKKCIRQKYSILHLPLPIQHVISSALYVMCVNQLFIFE